MTRDWRLLMRTFSVPAQPINSREIHLRGYVSITRRCNAVCGRSWSLAGRQIREPLFTSVTLTILTITGSIRTPAFMNPELAAMDGPFLSKCPISSKRVFSHSSTLKNVMSKKGNGREFSSKTRSFPFYPHQKAWNFNIVSSKKQLIKGRFREF